MLNRHLGFVHLENIKNFEKRLATETDARKKELLFRLMEKEKVQWISYVEACRRKVIS